MAQVLNHLPDKCGLHILCSYKNKTPYIEIACIFNIPNWYFERVIFPGEWLLFEALPEAVLEIYSTEETRPFWSDRFLCDSLKVKQTDELILEDIKRDRILQPY